MIHVERFAPSPTGPLHLGHAFSAMTAFDAASAAGGQFLLRIEDIDQSRSRTKWEAQIFDDLHWLGLEWPEPVLRQSTRLPGYQQSIAHLWARGLLYPCTCARKDIRAAANAPQDGEPVFGPDGIVYPGTCRHKPRDAANAIPDQAALRLDLKLALDILAGTSLTYTEIGQGAPKRIDPPDDLLTTVGDVVLRRPEMGTAYHLSVVMDDAEQSVTHVTRGQDLAEATIIHVILQKLLDLPTPIYRHHRLIRDENGQRLAKRHDARAISKFRAEGASPADIRRLVGLRAAS